MVDESIIEKIRKLRAVAERGKLGEAESALFAAKVAELLQEHGLSMSDIAEVDREDHVEDENFEMMYADPWRMSLFRSAEKLYFCYSFATEFLVQGKLRKGRVIVGRPHNVATLRETYQYLEETTLRLARDYARDNVGSYDSARACRIGFERGCGVRLAERLRDLYVQQSSSSAPPTATGGNLPALYATELALAKNFAHEKYQLSSGRGRGSSINAHGLSGMRAADGVSLSAQVSGSTRGNLLK